MNTIKGQVHLIETSENNPTRVQITKMPQKGKLVAHIAGGEFRKYLSMGYKPQHLYITTDEEIKKDNKFITVNPNTTMQGIIMTCTGINRFDEIMCKEDLHTERGWHRSNVRKIVATTNPKLWIKDAYSCKEEVNIAFEHVIYRIPQPFIEGYIKAYNEDNAITEVLIEQEEVTVKMSWMQDVKYWLKLDKDGCVVIHPIEEKMYTREEFRKAVRQAWIMSNGIVKFDEWFDKNYPT